MVFPFVLCFFFNLQNFSNMPVPFQKHQVR
jgi:hypothetical protein